MFLSTQVQVITIFHDPKPKIFTFGDVTVISLLLLFFVIGDVYTVENILILFKLYLNNIEEFSRFLAMKW